MFALTARASASMPSAASDSLLWLMYRILRSRVLTKLFLIGSTCASVRVLRTRLSLRTGTTTRRSARTLPVMRLLSMSSLVILRPLITSTSVWAPLLSIELFYRYISSIVGHRRIRSHTMRQPCDVMPFSERFKL